MKESRIALQAAALILAIIISTLLFSCKTKEKLEYIYQKDTLYVARHDTVWSNKVVTLYDTTYVHQKEVIIKDTTGNIINTYSYNNTYHGKASNKDSIKVVVIRDTVQAAATTVVKEKIRESRKPPWWIYILVALIILLVVEQEIRMSKRK